LQGRPARRGEHLFVALVGQPCVGYRCPPAQRGRRGGADLVQPGVNLGVHPGYEKRGHRRDRRQVPAGYRLSYRDVEELLAERGVTVDHVIIYRWVQRFTTEFIEAARMGRHAPGDRCSSMRHT